MANSVTYNRSNASNSAIDPYAIEDELGVVMQSFEYDIGTDTERVHSRSGGSAVIVNDLELTGELTIIHNNRSYTIEFIALDFTLDQTLIDDLIDAIRGGIDLAYTLNGHNFTINKSINSLKCVCSGCEMGIELEKPTSHQRSIVLEYMMGRFISNPCPLTMDSNDLHRATHPFGDNNIIVSGFHQSMI